MARVSFRLRRTAGVAGESASPATGSYLRSSDEFQTLSGHSPIDQDAALRSTGIIILDETVTESVFEAVAVGYSAVELSWQLSEPFSTIAELSSSTGLLEVAIVYSKTGYPETVSDGDLLFQAPINRYTHATNNQVFTQIISSSDLIGTFESEDVFEPESGRWAYYTLFGLYNQGGGNGTFYYNRLASLEVLLPRNYGSTEALWERIPQYYRELDEGSSFLYRYLSVFGFEIDRIRTLIDSVLTQYDPSLTEAESVAELAYMLGLEITPNDLGVTRARALLHDIGFLRRRKGTIDATKEYLTAVSGASVDVFSSNVAPYFTFCVHSQKCNLIANPRFKGNTSWTVAFENSTGGASVDSSANEGITIYSGSVPTTVAVRSTLQVPKVDDITYYMSAEISGPSVQYYEPQWNKTSTWTAWGSAASASPISYIDNSDGATRKAFVAENLSASVGYPVLVLGLPANSQVTINKWMLEPYLYGDFFDGDTYFSGFLYSAYGKDHVWEAGSGFEYASMSVYTANRVKTQDVIERMLPKILPVTLLGGASPKYQAFFDWVPGKRP